ncbi:MAG: class I SAM-dependent methyltransferase [Planctomycetota bacterium]
MAASPRTTSARPAPCDHCGATRTREVLRKNGHVYLECQECGLVRADMAPEAFFGLNEETFEGSLDHYAAKSYTPKKQRRYARRLRGLEPHRGAGRLCEVGANVGGFLAAARRAGWNPVGVEPVAACAEWARGNQGLDVRPTTLEDAAFPEGSFDVVYSNAVLEHLTSPRAVLDEIRRVLRPGGVTLCDTVNWASQTRERLGGGWKLADPLIHYHLFTPSTLAGLCEAAGLEVVRLRSHGVRLRPNAAPRLTGAARWVEELRKLPRSARARRDLSGESIAVLARRPG